MLYSDYEIKDSHYRQARETVALFSEKSDLVLVIADMLAEIESLKVESGVWQ